MKPLVAIVGRPNVGKSMLFNKLMRPAPLHRGGHPRRHPGPAVRRVRVEEPGVRHRGHRRHRAGDGRPDPAPSCGSRREIAIQTATVVVFVCDVKTGMTAADQEVANMLLRARQAGGAGGEQGGPGRRGRTRTSMSSITWAWATPSPSPPSTATAPATCWTPASSTSPPRRRRTRRTMSSRWPSSASPMWASPPWSTASWGRSGSSSAMWRAPPGTRWTVRFENGRGKYLFIDTAGMRKKSRVDDRIEKFSVLRATMAIERSDVCLIMIDAREGVTEQDTKVAGLAHEAGKACIIVVNKWDAIEKDGKTMDKMRQDVMRDLSYMTYAPIVFISALTGQRVDRLFELINYVNDQAATRITTGMLNIGAGRCHRPGAAPHGQGPPPEDLLHDPGGHPPPSLCVLLQRRPAVPLLLSAVSGEPDPSHLRPGGHAGAADHPAEGREGGVSNAGHDLGGHLPLDLL